MTTAEPLQDARSDYGSDLDTDGEQHVDALLTSIESGIKPLVIESIEDDARGILPVAHVPRWRSSQDSELDDETLLLAEARRFREPSVEYEYSKSSRTSFAGM